MIAELKITFSDPGAPGVYMYFEKTEDWSEELIQQFFEQNRDAFGGGSAQKIEQTLEYATREEAEASVRARSIDNWNHKDVYLWPPHVISPKPAFVPDYMPAQGREAVRVPPLPAEEAVRTGDPLPAEEVKTVSDAAS